MKGIGWFHRRLIWHVICLIFGRCAENSMGRWNAMTNLSFIVELGWSTAVLMVGSLFVWVVFGKFVLYFFVWFMW